MTNPPIIPAKTAIESFRDNGYRDTASAISEIIDNSIEAKAKNIKILVFEKSEIKANRPKKQISEIAIIIIAVNKVLTIRYITKFAYSNLVSYIEYYYRKT